MIDAFTAKHYEHVSTRLFEEVVAAFEAAVGSVEDGGFDQAVEGAKGPADFETKIRSREGASGFMRFLTVDHGSWLARIGMDAQAPMYTIGKPLIGRILFGHDLRSGPHLPNRLIVYLDSN